MIDPVRLEQNDYHPEYYRGLGSNERSTSIAKRLASIRFVAWPAPVQVMARLGHQPAPPIGRRSSQKTPLSAPKRKSDIIRIEIGHDLITLPGLYVGR